MGPYRPGAAEPDPELARLAAEGAQRRAQAASDALREQSRDGSRHLQTAIGAYRGSTLRRAILGVLIAAALVGGAFVVTREGPAQGGVVALVFGVTMPLFFLWLFVPPLASKGAIAQETAWLAGQPFELGGYFEMLAETPRYERRVTFQIVWREGVRPPDRALLFGALGAVDPAAEVRDCDARGAFVVSGPVSGQTGIRNNRVPVYRNHKLPARVHTVVDRVLAPLHRSHPIARVTITGR